MPYSSPSDAPPHVPESKRAQWVEVWNSAYQKAISEGHSAKDAEQSAFKQANGVTLSEPIAHLFSEIPPGTPRIPAQLVVYVELPGAVKDGECLVVEVAGGISMQHGCCDIWDDIEGESAASFQCGTCRYHTHPEHSTHFSGSAVKDCGPDSKAVGGQCVARGKFLIVGDPQKKETWKLPLHDENHIQDALSRFNQTEGATTADAHRLAGIAKSHGINLDKFKKHLSEGGMSASQIKFVTSPFTRLFSFALGGDAGNKHIPLAYTGTFVKGGEKFSITASDLETIVQNFGSKENGEVNLDYEHASEMPEMAKGGPVPSAGAFVKLTVEPGPDGTPWLFGEPNYTELAKSLIETKQYRYLSPAIDWSATNKTTGDPVGATLTSVALTNRPFLEKLPPLLMTEVPKLLTEETTMPDKETKKVTLADGEKPGKGQLRMRQVTDSGGTHIHVHAPAGGEGEAAFGELMGEIYPADWKAMTAAAAPPPDGATHTEPDGDEALAEKVGQALGAASPVTMTEVKTMYDAGREARRMADANTGFKLLSETISDKGFDTRKARVLLSEGKVSPQQFAAFENARELVEQGVEAGKIHPANRAFHLSDAMNRPAEFEKFLENAKPFVILDERGLPGTSPTGQITLTEEQRTKQEALAYMKENKCTYSVALKAINKRNPDRAQKMREERSRSARLM